MTVPAPRMDEEMRAARTDVAAQMRTALVDLAPSRNWSEELLAQAYDALDRLDFRALDALLTRMDP